MGSLAGSASGGAEEVVTYALERLPAPFNLSEPGGELVVHIISEYNSILQANMTVKIYLVSFYRNVRMSAVCYSRYAGYLK